MGLVARTARGLATHRTAVYVGGLGVVVVARSVPDGAVPTAVATGLVAAALGAMVVTYLAELAVAADAVDDPGRYSRRARLLVAAGLGGFAVGGAYALDGRPVVAAPFLVGAVLLVRTGVRRDAGERRVAG